jgi:hypothetical protein
MCVARKYNTGGSWLSKDASHKIRINVEDHAVLLDDELFQIFVSKPRNVLTSSTVAEV